MSNQKLITAFLVLCVAGMPFFSKAQVRPITGTVLDGKNHPIMGASILIQGKSQGTVTDEAGKFKLSLPENATLLISFTGYRSQTVKWNGSPDIKIDLVEDVARLDEIVVTGLSTSIKRRNLANSVATITATPQNGVASRRRLL